MKLILGSQSSNRQEVLKRAGIDFEVLAADIDEKAIRHDDFRQLPLLLARAKAEAIKPKIQEPALLVTADTVTIYKGALQEKPETLEEARKFLEAYIEEEPITVITGVTVTNTATGKHAEGVDIVLLGIKKLPAGLVEELLADQLTYTVAGGFTVYDERLQPYTVIQEGTLESTAGLPVHLMQQLITEVVY